MMHQTKTLGMIALQKNATRNTHDSFLQANSKKDAKVTALFPEDEKKMTKVQRKMTKPREDRVYQPEVIRCMRILYESGNYSYNGIGKKFFYWDEKKGQMVQPDSKTVSSIVHRKTYKDIK